VAVIDLDALEASIAEGEKKNFFVAPIVKELIAELREARGERAAVVAWLEELSASSLHRDPVEELLYASRSIERGEHRGEGER
jgi:hypothetical protein